MDNTKSQSQNYNRDFVSNDLNIREIINSIINGKWWVIASVFVTTIITGYYVYNIPPVFQATASIMIDIQNKAETIYDYSNPMEHSLADEIELMKSETVMLRVIEALWNSNHRNRLYLFGTKVFVPKGQRLRRPIKKIFSLGQWTPDLESPVQYDKQYNRKVGEEFKNRLANSLQVYSQGVNKINIIVNSHHPYESYLIANTVAQQYKIVEKEWSVIEAAGLRQFLNKGLKNKEIELDSLELLIENYKRENQIFNIETSFDRYFDRLSIYEDRVRDNIFQKQILQNELNYIATQLSEIESSMTDKLLSSIEAQLFSLRSQISEKESEIIRNSTLYGDNHEAVINAKQSLNKLKKQLKEKTDILISEGVSISDPIKFRQELIVEHVDKKSQLFLIDNNIIELHQAVGELKEVINGLPNKQSTIKKMLREYTVLEQSYSYMRQRMEETKLVLASATGKVRDISMATIPLKQESPNIIRSIISSILIGVGIGLFIIFIINYFDNTVNSTDYFERLKVPILGIIPSIGKQLGTKKSFFGFNSINKYNFNGRSIDNLQDRMITHEDPKSTIAEAYRSLRTSLMYSSSLVNHETNTIMISSPGPSEGKTTTIINLAITYANLGKRTLLIDGDLRRPVVKKVFNIDEKLGLTEYLSGINDSIDQIIFPTKIDNLHVICSGMIPPNPSELLGSIRMNTLLSELQDNYDIILFDAPPILAVTDAVILSQLIDHFILVVRFSITDKTALIQTFTSLENVNTKISGIVVNDFDANRAYYANHYYQYYQQYVLEKS